MRKRVNRILLVTILGCIVFISAKVYAGSFFAGNGHYFERILIPANFTWHQCRDSAIALGGYLATATTLDENNFICGLAQPYTTFLGGTDEISEGNWLWISGEIWTFTAWRAGEPNEAFSGEDYISLGPEDCLWNDSRNWFIDPQCFIVEIDSIIYQDTIQCDTLYEHFEGESLSPIWQRFGGADSDVLVGGSWLTIKSITNGTPEGPWAMLSLRTEFIAPKDFSVHISFHYDDAAYNQFRVELLDESGTSIYAFRLWDSPQDWILNGSVPPTGDCYQEHPRNYIPSDLILSRENDTISFTWSDTTHLMCQSTAMIAYIQLVFGQVITPFTPVSIDSIYGFAWPQRPILADLHFGISEVPSNIVNNCPKIVWNYFDCADLPQDSIEIAFGSDSDWAVAEMWDPGPVASADTFVTYAGAPLIDGETYYLRLRVHNGVVWSNWYYTTFRMNSVPSVPVLTSPPNNGIVNTTMPTLYVQNSTDAENDTLTYDFKIVNHSMHGSGEPIEDSNIVQGNDSTGWQVPVELNENWRYLWWGRAFDQYEKSPWSESKELWVNAVEETPWPFDLIIPPDTSGNIVFDMLPHFVWGLATDPDPLDMVRYTLYLALDSNFQYVKIIDTQIPPEENQYDATDSLFFGTRYWWKVKATDETGRYRNSGNILNFRTWKLGDASGDWNVNILDITFLINYLYKHATAPSPLKVGDVNGSCIVNIQDITYLINYLYKGGPAPKIGCAN
jgi:hypothetical protein